MTTVAAVFVLMMATILGAYWLFVVRPEQTEERALRHRLKPAGIRRTPGVGVVKPVEKLSAVGPLASVLSHREPMLGPIRRAITQSGKDVTVGTIVLACAFCGLTVFAIAWRLTGLFLIAAPVGALSATLPVLYLRRAARKRLARFEEQFPEAIDLLARALRAGHALTTGLQMVGDEIPEPVGGEFRLLFEQQNYGMSLTEALRAFADRVPLLDARFFVTALLTQRESGGNLSEILDNLANVIRERFRVKRQVRVISAHGRITGFTLGFLPPALAAVLLIISPAHMRLLVDDPIGVNMIAVAIILQVVGVLIIRRIVNVEY